jgi:tRNA(fMet)-specific endonuclease VapC
MRLAVDTNRYVDFCRGLPEAVERLREAERIYVPFVVLAELRAGFRCGKRAAHNERILIRFLNSPRVRVLHAGDQTTHHYARFFHHLREQGTPIPIHDIWIAALAVEHDLVVFTRDRHFDCMPGLTKI